MRMQAVAIVLIAVAAAACGKSSGASAPACPKAYRDFTDPANGEKTCSCPAAPASGSVWGVDIYTQDSSPCAAAVHAGVLQPSAGGTIRVKSAAGCPAYEGAARNGVTTSSWGSYPGSFIFPDKGEAKCPAAPAAAPTAACPASFGKIPNVGPDTEITCDCAASPTGTVWGAGVYTQDSSICAAALHAGVIPAGGGKVTAKASAGCEKYDTAAQNGVTTQSWGSFPASFYFPGKGDGKCGGAASGPCPPSFGAIPGLSASTEITCECDGAATGAGSVWGTGPYTQDSSICKAALHAGLIPAGGGKVSAKAGPGCSSYAAGTEGAVTTSSWGAFPASFDFPAKGARACP